MCGRFALTAPASVITEIFEVDVLPDVLPRYNIAPTQKVAVVLEEEGLRRMDRFRWGLIPSWAKDKKIAYKTINARSETAASKPSFRSAFKRRRCLILADGFYEWKRLSKTHKIPHLIGMNDGKPFGMAGLWEAWKDPNDPDAEWLETCTILTVGPNALMEEIHDRMPVILPKAAWDFWLDASVQDKGALQELMVPFPAEQMAARTVSSRVNNARNTGAEVQEPYEDDA